MTRPHEWMPSRAATHPASSAHAGVRRWSIQRRPDRSRANRQTLHNGTKLGILPGFFRYPIHVMQLFQWGDGGSTARRGHPRPRQREGPGPDFGPISRPGGPQTRVRPDFDPISRPGASQTHVRPDFDPISRPSYEKSQIFIVFRKIIYFLCERNILNELYYDRMVDFT